MTDTVAHEPRLLFPGLRSFYAAAQPLSWFIIRVSAGLMLIPHGWPKVQSGIAATAAAIAKRGIQPAEPFAVVITVIETIGGLCIALGLFTRFWAAAAAIEMAVIVYAYLPSGFGWTRPGYEYALLWGLTMLAIALRGGGPWSVDRKLGWEL